jgi:hypothetical protein
MRLNGPGVLLKRGALHLKHRRGGSILATGAQRGAMFQCSPFLTPETTLKRLP